jgi:hypothetical protein
MVIQSNLLRVILGQDIPIVYPNLNGPNLGEPRVVQVNLG